MTALAFSSSRSEVGRRRAGWIARLPGSLVAAMRATFIYGEAQRLCPPPA
jgi:hypothetical protein